MEDLLARLEKIVQRRLDEQQVAEAQHLQHLQHLHFPESSVRHPLGTARDRLINVNVHGLSPLNPFQCPPLPQADAAAEGAQDEEPQAVAAAA
eukprot:2435609-Prymnesium_polylepis.2